MPSSGANNLRAITIAAGLLAAEATMTAEAQDGYAVQRQAMLADIAALTRETRSESGRERLGDAVMAAMAKVPRHRFVPPAQERDAYANRPLPICSGQTISQPFIVALMTDLLDLKPGYKVLEIGTGCGYQAAVLGELAREVYTIEIIEPLAQESSARLASLGYRNITVRSGDGYQGWPEQAPFDAIIVTAAAREVPPALVEQLKPGGRLVIPVGPPSGAQRLVLIEKDAGGKVAQRNVLDVRFVPLTRAR
jgi:protein-L-isoaspartate(D-aspartate) O-methyltransferase